MLAGAAPSVQGAVWEVVEDNRARTVKRFVLLERLTSSAANHAFDCVKSLIEDPECETNYFDVVVCLFKLFSQKVGIDQPHEET